MRENELVGEQRCGAGQEQEVQGDGCLGEAKFKSVTWKTDEDKNKGRRETLIMPQVRRDRRGSGHKYDGDDDRMEHSLKIKKQGSGSTKKKRQREDRATKCRSR